MSRIRRIGLSMTVGLLALCIANAVVLAVDLTGSWWILSDPLYDGGGAANVTCNIVQAGNDLTFTNVPPNNNLDQTEVFTAETRRTQRQNP